MEIIVPFDVKKFINKEIPRNVRSQIVPLVQAAYQLVDEALKDVSFLKWALGKKHIGYLDNIAVQYTLYEAVLTGKLKNLQAFIEPNKNKSSYHVEIKTNNTVLTINRANNNSTSARKAIYRSILQKENQLFWDMNNQELKEEPGYLQLTHNHNNRIVKFVNLGVPDGRGKWYSVIDLTKELYLLDEGQEGNKITKEQLVKFKDFAQGVQDNGGKNQ